MNLFQGGSRLQFSLVLTLRLSLHSNARKNASTKASRSPPRFPGALSLARVCQGGTPKGLSASSKGACLISGGLFPHVYTLRRNGEQGPERSELRWARLLSASPRTLVGAEARLRPRFRQRSPTLRLFGHDNRFWGSSTRGRTRVRGSVRLFECYVVVPGARGRV